MKNEMKLEFDAISVNEGFARIAVAAFVSPLNPTLEELADIKTAVSEAVTNAIIHGYENLHGYGKYGDVQPSYIQTNPGKVFLRCILEDELLMIEVKDKGCGIADIDKAMEPLFTTKPEYNRSGMGFAFMESFMDDLEVKSVPGKGTVVRMLKNMKNVSEEDLSISRFVRMRSDLTGTELPGERDASEGDSLCGASMTEHAEEVCQV